MATISNTPRPGYVWDSTDNVWYPIGVGAHQHTNAADTPAVMPYSTYAAAGKNKILNGDFAINQRAFTSTTTTNTGMEDRWFSRAVGTTGTTTHTIETFTAGTAPVSGYESKNFHRIVTADQSSTNTVSAIRQAIEDVRTLAGQTVTVSFWAKAASGTPNIVPTLIQSFGSGGSPSSAVITPGTKQSITTSWARYSFTINNPSISGKTVGTANDSSLALFIYVSVGSDNDAASDTLGIQNNTFDIWGVQIEAGSTATAFQTATGNPASELATCQRYYYRITNTSGYFGLTGSAYATTGCYIHFPYAVTMRTLPSSLEFSGISAYDGTSTYNLSSLVLQGTTNNTGLITTTASGLTQHRPYTIIATSGTCYLAVSAEL